MKPLRIGIVGFDQVDALDLVGPAEAFASALAHDASGNQGSAYEVVILGLTNSHFVAESGIVFQPRTTLRAAPRLDTIIIPGGAGLRRADTNRAVARWIEDRAGKTRRIVSICTGIYALAASGLLDGRRVTTHWRFAADVTRRFPNLRVEPNALFIRDGNFYTSAGVTAGIDLTLALIEEDLGRKAALRVARDLVVYLKRPGGQDQYSEPLRFQTMATDRLAELASWIALTRSAISRSRSWPIAPVFPSVISSGVSRPPSVNRPAPSCRTAGWMKRDGVCRPRTSRSMPSPPPSVSKAPMPFAALFATAFASRPEGIGEILASMTNQLREERAIEAWEGHTPPPEACSVCLNGFPEHVAPLRRAVADLHLRPFT